MNQPTTKETNTPKGLKDYYSNYFAVGVSVSPRALKTDEAALVINQFNSLTPENAMKMAPIHPAENTYYWKDADSIVALLFYNDYNEINPVKRKKIIRLVKELQSKRYSYKWYWFAGALGS